MVAITHISMIEAHQLVILAKIPMGVRTVCFEGKVESKLTTTNSLNH